MLPVPPLDGGRVVHGLLPPRSAERFARLERFGIIAVLVGFFVRAADCGGVRPPRFNPLAEIVLPPMAAGFELIVDLFGVEALGVMAHLTPLEDGRRPAGYSYAPSQCSRG